MDKRLLSTRTRGAARPADTKNAAGGLAYQLGPEEALAQIATVGFLGDTYYTSAQAQLRQVLELAGEVGLEFLAKLTVYARQNALLKDMPALLLGVLHHRTKGEARTGRVGTLFHDVFPYVVDNGVMLRNFVQVVRSGVTGSKSLRRGARDRIAAALNAWPDWKVVKASIGNEPTLADVIKLARPRPKDDARRALFAWAIGKPCDTELLPADLQSLLWFRNGDIDEVPSVDWRLLQDRELTSDQWRSVAANMPWHALRMNLRTLQRHGALDDPQLNAQLAGRLADAETVRRARAYPWQIMMAYMMIRNDGSLPSMFEDALHDAMQASLENVPAIAGQTVVAIDVSGSMGSPVTGHRGTASSSVRCVDAAALIGAALATKSDDALILPFDTRLHELPKSEYSKRTPVMELAQRLARYGGGGTNCSLPLQAMVDQEFKADTVVYVSDYESWLDRQSHMYYHGPTGMAELWAQYTAKVNPKAKLVCIDLIPRGNTQADTKRDDVLQLGGFGDTCWDVISRWLEKPSEGFRHAVDSVTI